MTGGTDALTVYTRTKIRVPAPSSELIARPRLLTALAAAASAKLIVLQAPAGYGKTSLLQQWVAQLLEAGATVAWYTPDQGDRDAAVFLGYLMQALEQAGHRVSDQLRTLVSAETFYSWKIVATQLANGFIGAPSHCYMVIDDLHNLRDSDALACLRQLVESTPAEVHFVLASREDAGIPLGRLRALGRVFELRTPDLRFASTETASYFATRGHTQLTGDQLAALERRAEGWIVGLKLLSLALPWKRDEALGEIIATGEHAQVADFFAEDVLARQPHDIQEFLLRTCVLERLCPALCDSLPGVQGSRALIDRCDAGALFLVSLDQTRTWYRYHSLFADFLRRQLNDRLPGVADELNVAASRWLERAGFPAEAFDYALRGNNPIRAAEILDEQCDAMWSAGRQQVIQSLAERLPPHVQALYPRIMLAMAWRVLAQWKVDQAQQLVAVSRARLAEMERGGAQAPLIRNLRHRVLHRESQIAQHLYQLATVEKLSRQLMEEIAGDEDIPYLRASVLATLQYAQREQFQLENVHRLIEQSREAMERTGFSHGTIFLSALAGPSYVLAGRVQDAMRILTKALTIARNLTGHGSGLGSIVALHLAQLLYECNDVEGAGQLIEEYFRIDIPVGHSDQLVAGSITCSRLARLRGDFDSALEILREAADFAERHSVQRLRMVVAAEHVRVLLQMGRTDEAGQYARRIGLARAIEQPSRGRLTIADSAQAQAWCRLAASQGKVSEASAVARRWRAYVTTAEAAHSAVEWGVTVAELQVLSGDRKAAQRSLWQAVAHAAPARFIRVFLDEGEPIATLLEQMASGEPEPQDSAQMFLRELAATATGRSARPRQSDSESEPTQVVGRLSTRELEILVLAGSGMLNKHISEKLGLTEGTVKWYLQQAFDKLGVRDRARAASKARLLGLIG